MTSPAWVRALRSRVQQAAGVRLPRRLVECAGLCCLVLCLGAPPADGETGTLDEYDVKSAYLFNIARFVEWPDSLPAVPDSVFVIGVVGADPFGTKLDAHLRDREIHGRKIRVERRLHAADLPFCHMLFVALPAGEEARALLRRFDGQPVLTVGDRLPLAQDGGIMNFYLQNDAVRFEMNPRAIERSRLRVSSKLLSLARITPGAR